MFLPPIGIAPDAFKDADVGVVLLHRRKHGRIAVFRNEVIAVQKGDEFLGTIGKSRVARGAEPLIFLPDGAEDPWIGGHIAVDDPLAPVGGAIIDEDDLIVVDLLMQERIEAFLQIGFDIVYWDDDA